MLHFSVQKSFIYLQIYHHDKIKEKEKLTKLKENSSEKSSKSQKYVNDFSNV